LKTNLFILYIEYKPAIIIFYLYPVFLKVILCAVKMWSLIICLTMGIHKILFDKA
jgi:hypothetical protein